MSALIILLIGMLGDALAARLGRLNPQIVGVHTADFVEFDQAAGEKKANPDPTTR